MEIELEHLQQESWKRKRDVSWSKQGEEREAKITKLGNMPNVTGVWQTLCLNIVMLHRHQIVSGISRTCRETLVPPMVNKMQGELLDLLCKESLSIREVIVKNYHIDR